MGFFLLFCRGEVVARMLFLWQTLISLQIYHEAIWAPQGRFSVVNELPHHSNMSMHLSPHIMILNLYMCFIYKYINLYP